MKINQGVWMKVHLKDALLCSLNPGNRMNVNINSDLIVDVVFWCI